MGRWGPKNFQSDYTWDDLVVNVYNPIAKRMKDGLKRPRTMKADSPTADLIVAGLEVLTKLTKGLKLYLLPEPNELDLVELKFAFLASWDKTPANFWKDADQQKQRRKVIVKTFDEAIREVKKNLELRADLKKRAKKKVKKTRRFKTRKIIRRSSDS